MKSMHWALVLGVLLSLTAPLFAGEATPAAPASAGGDKATKAMEFFPLDTSGRLTRVDRAVMGVVVQDIRLTEVRSRQDAREYRLMVRVHNPGQRAAVPTLRLVLWSDTRPEIAFDIRGEVRHLTIRPRSTMRFLGDFEMSKSVQLTRCSLVPLPPEPIVMRADKPVPVSPVPPEQLVPSTEAESQDGGSGQQGQALDPEQARKLREAMEQYRAEVARMYLQQVMIPQANAMGTLAGIGPYGPIYQVPGGAGLNNLYIQVPSGWANLQSMPMMLNPMSVWVDPFQGR